MPRSDGLTLGSRRILAILHNRGNWVTRAEMASDLQYSELSTYQVGLLKRLIDKGLIEGRLTQIADDVLAYEYQVKP